MKTLFFVLVAFFAAAQAIAMSDVSQDEWIAFKNEHGKKYDSEAEDQNRMKIFMENKQRIAEHNRKYASGEVTYKQGINQFADLTFEEFYNRSHGYKKPSDKQ